MIVTILAIFVGGLVHVFDSLSGKLLHTIDTEGHKFVLSLDFVSSSVLTLLMRVDLICRVLTVAD